MKLTMVEWFIWSLWASLALLLTSNHPLSAALALVMAAALLGGLMGITTSNWLMAAIALVFLGGMMVIFLYFTSLVASEKLSFPPLPPLYLLILFVFLGTAFVVKGLYPSNLSGTFNFSSVGGSVNILLIAYLLASLLAAVEFTSNFKGALESQKF